MMRRCRNRVASGWNCDRQKTRNRQRTYLCDQRRPRNVLQRNFIWVWIWDSAHPLHAAHADAEANSGDYYLRPVLAPEATDPEQGTIMTFKLSGSRKCYFLDKQYKEPAAIPENKGHEMATWYAMQSTGDFANEGPDLNSGWPNLSEMIDGIDVEERATQATPKICPKPPQRVVKMETTGD